MLSHQGVLTATACAEVEPLGIEEVPEKVLVLQEGLETEGFTTSNGRQFIPNPYRVESILLVRMKQTRDKKADAEKKANRR